MVKPVSRLAVGKRLQRFGRNVGIEVGIGNTGMVIERGNRRVCAGVALDRVNRSVFGLDQIKRSLPVTWNSRQDRSTQAAISGLSTC